MLGNYVRARTVDTRHFPDDNAPGYEAKQPPVFPIHPEGLDSNYNKVIEKTFQEMYINVGMAN